MTHACWLFVALCAVGEPPIETKFLQVAPSLRKEDDLERSLYQKRAVVLLHGLLLHPISKANAGKALTQDWQRPDSKLVKAVARHADVFAFAYSENARIEEMALTPGLRDSVRRLRELGYLEIVLLGHSAGGIVARQFVEDFPDAGVTKVVQVCSPNGGSSWAKVQIGVRETQHEFLASLTKEARQKELAQRAAKVIPEDIEFVCVVGTGEILGDGAVTCRCQWTEDLQRQGIPAVGLPTLHFAAMRLTGSSEKLAEIVRQRYGRWDAKEVKQGRQRLFKGSNAEGP